MPPQTVHTSKSLFLPKIAEIEHFALRAAILDERQNYSGTISLASLQTAPRPLSSFDTHPRWLPVTQSARSRQS